MNKKLCEMSEFGIWNRWNYVMNSFKNNYPITLSHSQQSTACFYCWGQMILWKNLPSPIPSKSIKGHLNWHPGAPACGHGDMKTGPHQVLAANLTQSQPVGLITSTLLILMPPPSFWSLLYLFLFILSSWNFFSEAEGSGIL